jgi:hypothetical protein
MTLGLILVLGFIFFAFNAHLQLATDDIGWLNGEAPTVFDQYRVIPRFFFVSLFTFFGPNPLAALGMIFFFHILNTVLVFDLAKKLFKSSIASITAAFVFSVNPLTLSTLTWISCFSYVIGTTMVLLSIEAFMKGMATARYKFWWAISVAVFIIGLFCSHEIIFFPVVYLLLSWMTGKDRYRPVLILFAFSMCVAVMIYFAFYRFEQYGVDHTRLLSIPFASAYSSSLLSLGVILGLAYPVSFFFHPIPFLQFNFTETVRWSITLSVLISTIILYRPNMKWRGWIFLAGACAVLITPYIVRFVLMPEGVNYDISYILTGRVFYLPFVIIALFWGKVSADFYETFLRHKKWRRAFVLVPLCAYLYALWFLYSPSDFMGLAVMRENPGTFPPPWNPYLGDHPVWLISLVFICLAFGFRLLRERQVHFRSPFVQ